jgi:hypothetical protein
MVAHSYKPSYPGGGGERSQSKAETGGKNKLKQKVLGACLKWSEFSNPQYQKKKRERNLTYVATLQPGGLCAREISQSQKGQGVCDRAYKRVKAWLPGVGERGMQTF